MIGAGAGLLSDCMHPTVEAPPRREAMAAIQRYWRLRRDSFVAK